MITKPFLYKEEHCELIVKLAREGKFLEEIATEIGVTVRTLRNWCKDFEEFRRHYDIAKDIIIANLKRKLLDVASQRGVNTRGYEFLIEQMTRQNRFAAVRIVGISTGTIDEKVDKVLEALELEELRAEEAQALMNVLKTAQEIKEARKALDKLEKIEEKK